MNKEFINPSALSNWEQTFSQIVIVSAGSTNTVYISGQVSVDENQNLIGKDDLKPQALKGLSEFRDRFDCGCG